MFRCAQLAVATPWSFHWGASKVEALAERAAARGVMALGMADRNGLWGALPFQKACEANGIKPLLGLRLRVEGVEAQLIAVEQRGYAALCRLSTRAQLEHVAAEAGGVGRSRKLQDWLLAESDAGCAVLSRDGALLAALRESGAPGGLYVALRPGPFGRAELLLAEELELPPIAAPDVAFADPADFERHALLVCMGRNTTRSRLDPGLLAPPHAWLKGPAEMTVDYAHAPQALRNAVELAERCDCRIPTDRKRLPRYPLPGGASAAAELARRCEEGRRSRGLAGPDARYRGQLRKELDLIARLGFADYFLIVSDIVRWTREQGIQNCGRGSVANSLVSYLLGFTHVDPLRHGLYFERFLNSGRSDLPDIDLDFAWDERDAVLDFVYRCFGRERVAMISTHASFGARGAIRELAKAEGVPASEIGPITRALPWYFQGELAGAALRRLPACARLPLDAEPWRTILRRADEIQEFPRHLGIHAGGVVIAPGVLTDCLPLQHAAKETGDGLVVITQWDMYAVEEAGLAKIDLLGNRGLAVIRDAAAAVARNCGSGPDFARLDPQRDARTGELLERGDTMGCFYIESPSMRSLLQKLRCRSFEVLVAASSIIRPGIASSGMMQAYVERFHEARATGRHRDAWYLHPELRHLLGETFGVMAYQEDVLKVAETVAGMSPQDADGLRRAMSRKRAAALLEAYHQQFLSGALARGLNRPTAEELWRQIESFSGYSFCKAHSASYAEVSYRSAYLRAHHPAEFMAAVLGNYGGYYSTFAYLAEAVRMGLRLQLPCVNRSGDSFQGRDGAIRVGLRQIRGLSVTTRAAILAARTAGGPFPGFDDLLARVRPAPDELEALVRAGACDALADGMPRAQRMRAAALYARRYADPLRRTGTLFGTGRAARSALPQAPATAEYGRERLLRQELEALGFLVSAHPLELYRERIAASGAIRACDLREHLNRRVRLVGWQVTQKPLHTRGGEPMLFLTFEDTSALYETVMFPQVYRRLAPWVLTAGPYLLEGVPRDDYGAITVTVSDLRLLEPESGMPRGRRAVPGAPATAAAAGE
ncbi:MAG: DNA polymerase III subunit alpha [Planctomycetota bacterium]|nr:MAG: DNA polymerase III subunit alpha [Planctomycetota bacterium]